VVIKRTARRTVMPNAPQRELSRQRVQSQLFVCLALCVVSLSALLKLSLFLCAKCQPETRGADAVDIKEGLPKALAPIRKQFDYLVRKQYR
jgi:hypothetical protein